jgi:hypothetical protein
MDDPEATAFEENDDKPDEPGSSQSTESQKQKPPEDPPEPECPPPPETSGCEPGVDDLSCVAAGDKAKAAYHDTFAADLTQAKIDYEETRKGYRTEQHDAAPVVQGLENEIGHLVERIKCQIEQKRVWRCLDDAFCKVLEEIKCCPKPDPCCEEPCEFPLEDIDCKTATELAQLIAEYQQRTDAAKQCFTDLKDEPADLKQRVEDVKTEVASITTDLGEDPATLDLKRLYARALVVQWKIKRVWGAFGQVQEFVDCLCHALTCWTKGAYAVYQLSGAKAVAECKEQAKKDRCDKLRNETVEQVLAAYDRLCAEPECTDEPSDCDDDSDEEPSDDPEKGGDCSEHHHHDDCGGHHHHHHHDERAD